ncbi:LytTR family DNA-binding domain-containing protein [Luteimonas sp. RD2P54]|uniref:LytTR family DNA-binding domain-containing protein n=1 Tax=Luteimonas endophytica TaxID=3042023 RepID=A0ABT6JDZ3_9GAMM|nr:LytTR family DNA-binding domain-containing protein [Luteimonas endophytica]MDH5825046.1 LytTR family DNA-binding domain-containing protein [Luteimonas endophytica]
MPSCVIAEDEDLLRAALASLLAEAWPELEIAALCEDGGSALEAIADHAPDYAFLDIRMPGLTGLEVAAAAAESNPATRVVFVTAYDQYALDAFERGAVDYLLKPVTRERLDATVRRLQARSGESHPDAATLAVLLRQLQAQPRGDAPEPLSWITASNGRETRLILVEDVLYFRADNKYTVAVTAEGEALLRTPVRELLGLLDPAVFKQVHRATIVNIKAIAAVVREDGGRGLLRLRGRDETLPVSQPFMPLFRNM